MFGVRVGVRVKSWIKVRIRYWSSRIRIKVKVGVILRCIKIQTFMKFLLQIHWNWI